MPAEQVLGLASYRKTLLQEIGIWFNVDLVFLQSCGDIEPPQEIISFTSNKKNLAHLCDQ